MTGLENAQHDLTDAQFSLETAIELLDSLEHDGTEVPQQLHGVIAHLRNIKTELDMSFSQLMELQQQETH
jgi:vacuolar-type H+-ATPase subunit E/Vma4